MIIDMRVRPPCRGFLETRWYRDIERTAAICRMHGHELPPSVRGASWDAFLTEFGGSGVDVAVVPGRFAGRTTERVSNEDLGWVVREGGGRFVGFASVDVDSPDAPDRLEWAVRDLGLKGLALEPGYANPPRFAEDPSLQPLYDRCLQLEVPVMLTISGSVGPDIGYADPVHIDRLAGSYPRLQVVVAHAGWPRIMEMIGVAYRQPNVWISPDQYAVNLPGALQFVEAANGFLRDRLLFGSSYPYLPMAGALAGYRALPFRAEVLDAVLGGNARRLLGMA